MPHIQELTLNNRSGFAGFQSIAIEVDNSDQLLNGIELQNAFVRISLVNEDGTVIHEFKGVITNWSLGVVTIINMEDLSSDIFDALL